MAFCACAHGHASLVKADPADGSVIARPPATLTLHFNEPVSPLVLRLLGPQGEPIALGAIQATNAMISIAAPDLRRGTHLLSWRVISADGHPVGGTVAFSIGAPSAQPLAHVVSTADRSVAVLLWGARVAVYVGLLAGAGGAFFRSWFSMAPATGARSSSALLSAQLLGLFGTAASIGLQGADALDLPVAGLMSFPPWRQGIATSYGLTAILAATALLASFFAGRAKSTRAARALSLAGLLGAGVALASSGHASTAPPQLVSRPALFLHVICIGFWIGALLPLCNALRDGSPAEPELTSFSRAIPLPLVIMISTGIWLAAVQVVRIETLWTTRYGQVLIFKIAAVAALLGLAGWNRYWLVPKRKSGDVIAARMLRNSIPVEIVLALAIVGLVALWRFTPPPRALADALPFSLHLHGDKAMAEITIERSSTQGAAASMVILNGEFQPLHVEQVTLVFANSSAGIEPMIRPGVRTGENTWRADDIRVPIDGPWQVSVEILISDFEKAVVGDAVTLPRIP